jgi:hypothetical protein
MAKIAGTNGISPALLLGKYDNSFSRTPSFGFSPFLKANIYVTKYHQFLQFTSKSDNTQ